MKDYVAAVSGHEERMRGLLSQLEAELRGVPDLFGGIVPLVSVRLILRFDRKTGTLIASNISPEYEEKFTS